MKRLLVLLVATLLVSTAFAIDQGKVFETFAADCAALTGIAAKP